MVKKRWLWVVLILAIALCVGVWVTVPDVPTTVKTAVLSPTRVEHTITCNGVVEAADGVGVFAPVTCRLKEVCVAEGQRVNKGDVVALVDKEATLAASSDVAVQVLLAAMPEELVAPVDGVVVEIGGKAGEALPLGTPCVLLVQPCDLRVRVAIREKDLRVLREGMSVRISGDGLEKTSYSGVLTDIAGTASSSGAATVVSAVVIPDQGEADSSFRLGLTAKATVITSVTESGCVIPYEAVLADEAGSYCYVLQEGVARKLRIADATQTTRGWLLADGTLADAVVILEPEKVTGDGAAVTEAKP